MMCEFISHNLEWDILEYNDSYSEKEITLR